MKAVHKAKAAPIGKNLIQQVLPKLEHFEGMSSERLIG